MMKLYRSILIIFGALILISNSFAQNYAPCPNYSFTGLEALFQQGDYGYYLSTEAMTWQDAAAFCENQGGQLATIHNQYLNSILRNEIGNTSAYIGFNDFENEGTFSWHSGEFTSYDKLTSSNSPAGDFVSLNFWNADWSLNRASTKLPFLMQVYCPIVLEELPDLNTSEIVVPISASNSESISFEFWLNNLMPIDAANSYYINVYLSLDNHLSSEDIAVGEIQTGFTQGAFTDHIVCDNCASIPYDITPGNYFLILEVDATDVFQEYNENNNITFSETIISIDAALISDPCDVSLGYFSNTYCTSFDENGGITVVGKTSAGNLVENQYSELGVLQSSVPFTGPISTEIINNAIVEKDFSGNTITTIPIDPNLVSLYTTGNNSFGQIAQNANGEFYVIGRIVGPTPAPFVPSSQPNYETTVDEFHIYHLDNNGIEIDQELIAERTYNNRDIYFLELEGVFDYKGIIPHADGKISVYLKHYQTWLGSNNPSGFNHFEYIVDFAQQTTTESILDNPSGFNSSSSNSIESNLCDYEKFQSIYTFGTWSPHGSSNSTTISYLDYGVTPTNMYKRTYQYYGNTYGQGNEEFHLIIPNIDGSEFQITRTESITEPFLPGYFNTQLMASDSTITEVDSIFLMGFPEEVFELLDGTFTVISNLDGNITLSNSACLPPMPENLFDQRNKMVYQANFVIDYVFPNPTHETLCFKIDNQKDQTLQYTIVDGQGSVIAQKMMDIEIGLNSHEINVENLSSGIYFIRFDGVESGITHRFVKI